MVLQATKTFVWFLDTLQIWFPGRRLTLLPLELQLRSFLCDYHDCVHERFFVVNCLRNFVSVTETGFLLLRTV